MFRFFTKSLKHPIRYYNLSLRPKDPNLTSTTTRTTHTQPVPTLDYSKPHFMQPGPKPITSMSVYHVYMRTILIHSAAYFYRRSQTPILARRLAYPGGRVGLGSHPRHLLHRMKPAVQLPTDLSRLLISVVQLETHATITEHEYP